MAKDTDDRSAPPLSRRGFLAAAGAGALAGLSGCAGVLAGSAREVNIAGSSTVFPVTEAVASQFTRDRSDVTISISQTGTGGGFSNFFCPGMTDVNNASREIDPDEEVTRCEDNGVEPIEFVVARDALTVIANPAADWIDHLTVDELREVWRAGGAETWDEVRGGSEGFPAGEIEHYGADTTSGTFDYFNEHALGEDVNHRSDYHPTERDRTIVQGVEGNEYATGYFGFAYYHENPDRVEALAIDEGDGPVEPSIETARTEEYDLLSRDLYIYVAKESLARPAVREFVEYYIEQAAEDVVADVGYVPVSEDQRDENLDKLERAIDEVNA